MSVNRDLPHLLVLPEDDANRQLAVGFHLELNQIRQMQVLQPARGWNKVLDEFKEVHVSAMNRNLKRFVVLLIDLDGNSGRLGYAKGLVPAHLADRVFILGVWTKPEDLENGFLENFGEALARDCREETSRTWDHALLKHNEPEVARLRTLVRPFLFA
jgi:hypothetical protein